ncbi:phosphoenolpyruvate--protein phosphotransferase [Pleomorphomonas carboxyditropha]|uniref:phosphoenolpyruvate--protein phosphotransferase n=1 Tax=Pleomorphomonas carboxyditropha TaxID=2023338 RepID=A0A2G9WQU2_9HYPH|nr:phosphoenolpyruvate--protein phosphotransferase [Pleomorphomonas carboxyditropha]PIO97066.1 phosphoenolpyruvate--protein phosphotransferase [Pleomorphomonas carboxyditropha]
MSISTKPLLAPELTRLKAAPADKEAAIRQACALLADAGYIDPAYADSMMRREAVAETYLGQGVAIPHGMNADRGLIRHNGLAILQIPGGLAWNEGQIVKLVVAIAAQSDDHIAVLRRLTRLFQDEAALEALFVTDDPLAIIAALDETAAANFAADAAGAAVPADLALAIEWTVAYPNGLHARPASRWVDAAKAAGTRLQVRRGADVADPTRLVSLLQLGLRAGETVTVSADGDNAAVALSTFMRVIEGLSAEEQADAAKAPPPAGRKGWTPATNLKTFSGVAAAPGVVIAPVHVLKAASVEIADTPMDLVAASAALDQAIAATLGELKTVAAEAAVKVGQAEAAIFEAQAELLSDPEILTKASVLVVGGHGPAWSWRAAVEEVAVSLESNANPLLAARASDVRDVGRRVLAKLAPEVAIRSAIVLPSTPSILVAADLTPSDTIGLDTTLIAGLATAQGGPTSHTAILARTLGLPAVVAMGAGILEAKAGTTAILDGAGGRLYLDPGEADLASARAFIEADVRRTASEAEGRALPAATTDGHAIEIGANINKPSDVAGAIDQGAEGVGLMRTEFLFLDGGHTPDEEEQFATYGAMAENLGGRPLIVRTLDIGGDKQAPHLKLPREENPFLGVRGTRLTLRRPDLMRPQLRALYRVAKAGANLKIMLPMITSLDEILAVRAVAEEIRAEVGAPAVPLGIMVEVPSTAVMADVYAEYVDFFSIGTNDLTQYTLAIDRQHPELAAEADSLHPAVLRLIRKTVEGAARHRRWVGVCGGIAGDPFGASLLAGLGVDELSMTVRDIPAVKVRLRSASMADLKALADKAVAARTAGEVRALEASFGQGDAA